MGLVATTYAYFGAMYAYLSTHVCRPVELCMPPFATSPHHGRRQFSQQLAGTTAAARCRPAAINIPH